MRLLRARNPDLMLVLLFLAASLVERTVAPEGEGSPPAEVLGALIMSVPLYWLRRHPLPVLLVLLPAGFVNHLIATDTDEMFSAIVLLIALGFVIARHHEGRARWVPLAVAAGGVGVIEQVFGSGDASFVVTLVAGGAVGGAAVRSRADLTRRLAERTHELEALRDARGRDAALDERRRIARELHDVVAHTVSVMVVQAAGARRQAPRDPGRALAALDQVRRTGEETLAELDRLFGLLHGGGADGPTGLDDLRGLVARVSGAGLPVDLEVRGDERPIDPEAALTAYRVVQEALTNTLKHAGPATARVEVSWEEDALAVVVTDTGAGGVQGEGSRSGLAGMRERVAGLGGELEAGRMAAGGFEVRARLPLAQEEVHAA